MGGFDNKRFSVGGWQFITGDDGREVLGGQAQRRQPNRAAAARALSRLPRLAD